MIEKRQLRFANIDGIGQSDLPLASEVWLEDLKSQSWTTREVIKMGTLFMVYLTDPEGKALGFSRIERSCQLDASQAIESLRVMKIFGFIESYTSDTDTFTACLTLTMLQRLRVLEVRQRFAELRDDADVVEAVEVAERPAPSVDDMIDALVQTSSEAVAVLEEVA